MNTEVVDIPYQNYYHITSPYLSDVYAVSGHYNIQDVIMEYCKFVNREHLCHLDRSKNLPFTIRTPSNQMLNFVMYATLGFKSINGSDIDARVGLVLGKTSLLIFRLKLDR